MSAFPTFPDWLPWWVPIVVLVPVLLYLLVFLAMPLSVFGVKGRLEILEARLDEIQGEIRMLALRLPEPGRAGQFRDLDPVELRPHAERPPIPPSRGEPPHWDAPPRRPVFRDSAPREASRDDDAGHLRREPPTRDAYRDETRRASPVNDATDPDDREPGQEPGPIPPAPQPQRPEPRLRWPR